MSKSKKKATEPVEKDIEKLEEEAETEVAEVEEFAEAVEDTAEEETEEPEAEEADASDDAEEESEDEEAEEETEVKAEKKPAVKKNSGNGSKKDEFTKLPFIEKCKRDPVIPVTILLAFVMIIVAIVYFMLPDVKAPSMGMTLDDFKSNFNNCETTVYFFQTGYDISIQSVDYVDREKTPGILGNTETYTVNKSYVDYFTGKASVIFDAGIEGATRKSDNELTHIRVFVSYSAESDNDPYTVLMFFTAYLQALYPDLTEDDAKNIALNDMSQPAGDGLFIKRGDIAYRWFLLKPGAAGNEKAYIIIEAIPASVLKDEQIARTYEVSAAPAATTADTAAVSESN